MTTSQQRLATAVHSFLRSPAAYPDRPKQVQVKETHASWVYITDRFVYKQKKPVKFEFLDFSTLDRRKHFCSQELSLNRRFSTDVYHRIVPVSVGSNHQFQLKSGPRIVEWLVKMKRLDENQTLEAHLRRDGLSNSKLRRLASHLTSAFSGQAPAVLQCDHFIASIERHIAANQNDLLNILPTAADRIRYLTSAQRRYIAIEQNLIRKRVVDGRIIDGHGDLRPEHIYFENEAPQIIDCAEFAEEYRTNDVLDELAFLAMECDGLNDETVGRTIISDYCDQCSDEAPEHLVAFYKCYRACVRAKTCALRARQKTEANVHEQASSYLQLGERYSAQFAPKLLILVGGLSGTGKSTLARALNEKLSGELLQTDMVRRRLFAKSENGSRYSPENRKRVYSEMLKNADQAFERSPTVIFDGTFSSRSDRERASAFAKTSGVRMLQIHCECKPELARQRVMNRLTNSADASEATPAILDQQIAKYEPPLDDVPTIRIDTGGEQPVNLERILSECGTLSLDDLASATTLCHASE